MGDSSAITVAIGRFDDLLARGLRGLVQDDQRLELVADGLAIGELTSLLRRQAPRVAILDLDAMSSLADVRALSSRSRDTDLLVLANQPSSVESAQLLAFGAAACLAKSTQSRDVLNAIHLASRGLRLAPRKGAAPRGSGLLTARETDVLECLQRRRSNSQIAAELHVSIETVRTHARNIYTKLGVRSRRELLDPTPLPARAGRLVSDE